MQDFGGLEKRQDGRWPCGVEEEEERVGGGEGGRVSTRGEIIRRKETMWNGIVKWQGKENGRKVNMIPKNEGGNRSMTEKMGKLVRGEGKREGSR